MRRVCAHRIGLTGRAIAKQSATCRLSERRQVVFAVLRWHISTALRKYGNTHAPPNFQTGMPSFLALSARLAEMPEPGKTMTPIGNTSMIWSLRLNGAALA